MNTALYMIPPLAAAVVLLVRAKFREQRRQIYIIKPLATLIVIVVALMSLYEPFRNMNYTWGVLVALFFSLGGDIALMFPDKGKSFKIGLVFFLAAHIRYTILFLMLGRFTRLDILPALILLAAGVIFYMMIKHNLGSMKGAVIVYIIVISVMVSRAISVFMSPVFTTTQALMIGSGALLFYISDVILAADRYWKPWRYHHISLAFYYSGQLLLALAASYFIALT